MDSVEQTLSYAVEMQRPVLVYGADLEPATLSAKVEALLGKGHVFHVDWRFGPPTGEALARGLAEGLRSGNALHVSIDAAAPPALLHAIDAVLRENRIPGAAADARPEGLVVVSARVRWAAELSDELREYFPICVGAE